MISAIERTAITIDKRGNTALQYLLPTNEFDHLAGKYIDVEKTPNPRKLGIWMICKSIMDRTTSKAFAEQYFVEVMREAFLHSSDVDKQSEKTVLICPILEGRDYQLGIRIYSRPDIKGVRILGIYDGDKVIYDVTGNNASLIYHQSVDHETIKIEEPDIIPILSEFLVMDDELNLDDSEEAARVATEADELHKAIFLGGEL